MRRTPCYHTFHARCLLGSVRYQRERLAERAAVHAARGCTSADHGGLHCPLCRLPLDDALAAQLDVRAALGAMHTARTLLIPKTAARRSYVTRTHPGGCNNGRRRRHWRTRSGRRSRAVCGARGGARGLRTVARDAAAAARGRRPDRRGGKPAPTAGRRDDRGPAAAGARARARARARRTPARDRRRARARAGAAPAQRLPGPPARPVGAGGQGDRARPRPQRASALERHAR